MYKSLTKTKKYSELEAHETPKRVASANAIIKHYKSSSLINVKRHAMVLSFLKANLVFAILQFQRERQLCRKQRHNRKCRRRGRSCTSSVSSGT